MSDNLLWWPEQTNRPAFRVPDITREPWSIIHRICPSVGVYPTFSHSCNDAMNFGQEYCRNKAWPSQQSILRVSWCWYTHRRDACGGHHRTLENGVALSHPGWDDCLCKGLASREAGWEAYRTLYYFYFLFIYLFIFIYFFIGVKSLHSVVLVSAVQWSESAICIHVSPPCWTSLPPPLPPDVGRHRAPSWAPCAVPQVPTSYLFYAWQCIYVKPNLPIHPILPFPHCVHTSVLYICISIPALQIGSSVPFF